MSFYYIKSSDFIGRIALQQIHTEPQYDDSIAVYVSSPEEAVEYFIAFSESEKFSLQETREQAL